MRLIIAVVVVAAVCAMWLAVGRYDSVALAGPTTAPSSEGVNAMPEHTKIAADGTKAPTTNAVVCKPGEPSACGDTPWKNLTDAELRAKLSPEQYNIARQAGTERAFTGKYWDDHRAGVYHCAVCGQSLFNANTKFESGTGWPSFYVPLNKSAVTEKTDTAYGMKRTEVLCSRCQSHLGHVFEDGPAPTGLRYCMNSAVLDLHVDEKP